MLLGENSLSSGKEVILPLKLDGRINLSIEKSKSVIWSKDEEEEPEKESNKDSYTKESAPDRPVRISAPDFPIIILSELLPIILLGSGLPVRRSGREGVERSWVYCEAKLNIGSEATYAEGTNE